MRQPRPLQVPTHACVSPLARWRESQLEMAMAQARYRLIFPFAVPYQRLGATNRAPAAAGKNTKTAAAARRKSQSAIGSARHSERNRGMEQVGRDMTVKAAGAIRKS